MGDWAIELAAGAMGSPWVFLALFAFAAIDVVIPLIPSDGLVITAGVFAAAGEPDLGFVIAASAAGAFTGDHSAYLIGRTAGRRLASRRTPGSKPARAFAWAGEMLDRRGGVILVACRYIPGARTATTMTAGAVAYPLGRFSLFDGIAALSWATYSAAVGYVGGAAFEQDPVKGLALGLGLALGVTALVEVARHVRVRRHRTRAQREGTPQFSFLPKERDHCPRGH